MPWLGSWKRTLLVVLAVLLTSHTQHAQMPDDEAARDADRTLEHYRALDVLAVAVFQVGTTIGVGGVTIGLAVASRYREIIIVGSVLPLLAGLYAALSMVDRDEGTPDAARLKKKRREVRDATLGLVLCVLFVVGVFLLLLALTSESRLGSLL